MTSNHAEDTELPKIKRVNSSISMKENEEKDMLNLMVDVIHQIVHDWKDAKKEEIEFKKFTGGISNFLYCAKWTTTNQRVLIRIYGDNTEQIIDRNKENLFMDTLGYLPFIAKIYGCFSNGVIYEYLPGQTLKPNQMIENYEGIAKRLADLHKQHVSQIDTILIWDHIKKILDLLEEGDFSDTKYNQDYLYKLLEIMKEKIGDKYNNTVVLCHNDLLSGNILKDGENINLIDYEYGSYNYRGYDIGNHFAECMGFNIKTEHYPNKKQQYDFLTTYFNEYFDKSPTEEELRNFYREVNVFSLCSHFFWGSWGFLQNRLNKSIDFNYKDYAINKMELIERNMQNFFDNEGESEYTYI